MSDQPKGLRDATDVLRRRWLTALLVTVPLAAGVVSYAESLPALYDGEAIVAFSPKAGVDISADTVRVTVPKYVAYLSSRATARSVARRLGLDEQTLYEGTNVSVAPDTANLTVAVRLRDPDDAARAAQVLSDEAVAFSSIDEQLTGRVVAPSIPATTPAAPPRRLIEGGGLLLALLLGVSAALLADRARPRVTDPLGLALASGHGVIGRLPASRSARSRDPLADPVLGTAVRALRTQLEQRSTTGGCRTLALTSPLPGEGKTTVAYSLALAYARVDVKVLLIDADMRRPRIAERLGLDQDHVGLAEVLEGGASVEQAVQQGAVAGLEVITTTARDRAGDLLARRLPAFLATVQSRYDVVLVDCPPVLATDDARTLTLHCDGTILVVASGSETRRVAEAAASLASLNVTVLGAVLNRSRLPRRQGLGSYGAYG